MAQHPCLRHATDGRSRAGEGSPRTAAEPAHLSRSLRRERARPAPACMSAPSGRTTPATPPRWGHWIAGIRRVDFKPIGRPGDGRYVNPTYLPDDEPDHYGVRAGEDYPGCPGLSRPSVDELRRRDRNRWMVKDNAATQLGLRDGRNSVS